MEAITYSAQCLTWFEYATSAFKRTVLQIQMMRISLNETRSINYVAPSPAYHIISPSCIRMYPIRIPRRKFMGISKHFAIPTYLPTYAYTRFFFFFLFFLIKLKNPIISLYNMVKYNTCSVCMERNVYPYRVVCKLFIPVAVSQSVSHKCWKLFKVKNHFCCVPVE